MTTTRYINIILPTQVSETLYLLPSRQGFSRRSLVWMLCVRVVVVLVFVCVSVCVHTCTV